jgi:hypothetical protein
MVEDGFAMARQYPIRRASGFLELSDAREAGLRAESTG